MSYEYPELTLLGSTGSIGRQALELADAKNIKINGLAANKSVAEVEKQARRFKPSFCVMSDPRAAADLKDRLADTEITVLSGDDGMTELIGRTRGVVLNAVIGSAGLKPTLDTIDAGRELALANKESLVMAGDIVMSRAKEKGITLRPVDSEHSAIWQCLRGSSHGELKKLILTASGGPFFGMKRDELESKGLDDALAHPTWNMGRAITIDSATLMNKGFEVIEAAKLFGVDADHIEVLVHRESIIHSMTEYIDNSVIAQLSPPDMRLCINYALTYPRRESGVTPSLDLASMGRLTFAAPDCETFTLLPLAFKALRAGGALPAVLHAANEETVGAFLDGRITKFTDIQDTVCRVVDELSEYCSKTELSDVFEADSAARQRVLELI